MELKHAKLYQRNEVIYIDATLSELGRIRFSTKLKATKENLAHVTLKIKDLVWEALGLQLKQESGRIALESLGQRYISEQCAHLKAQTLKKYRANLSSLAKHFGTKDIRLIHQEEAQAYAQKYASQTYKIAFFNRLLSYAKEEGINLKLKGLKIHKALQAQSTLKDVLPLSEQEIKLVLNHAQGSLKDYLYIAFFTGMRTGEILALESGDIDFKHNKILVSKSLEYATGQITDTKTHKARYIDLLPILVPALKALCAQNVADNEADNVGICGGQNVGGQKSKANHARLIHESPKTLLKLWHKLLAELGLQKRALYQTRHSFATLMLMNNEEPLWVSSMLGHASLQTTFTHYVRYIPTQKPRAAFLDSMFGGGK